VAHQTSGAELEFTTHRITRNFSNYSAWHYRSAALTKMHSTASAASVAASTTVHGDDGGSTAAVGTLPISAAGVAGNGTGGTGSSRPAIIPLAALRDEMALVRQAVFTEPDDQSAWFYHRWLVAQVKPHLVATHTDAPASDLTALRVVVADILALYQLRAASPKSKCESHCGTPIAISAHATAPVSSRPVPVSQGPLSRWRMCCRRWLVPA